MNVLSPFEEEKKKLPTMLNVLTILTFIGSAFQLVSIPLSKFGMKFAKQAMDNPEVLEKLSERDLQDIEKQGRAFDMMMANTTPLWIVVILSAALCVYGAIQMRKLKKDGFYIYSVGEILPVIGYVIIIGWDLTFINNQSYFFNIGIPLLFIALYASQLKHMK